MKRQWKVRRERHPAADAWQRWDQAYPKILAWSQARIELQAKEEKHEGCPVCACQREARTKNTALRRNSSDSLHKLNNINGRFGVNSSTAMTATAERPLPVQVLPPDPSRTVVEWLEPDGIFDAQHREHSRLSETEVVEGEARRGRHGHGVAVKFSLGLPHHALTVSWLTSTPRSNKSSCTSR